MKTIQCTLPPHHRNSFVATCQLWTAIGGVHALLTLETTECSASTKQGAYYIYSEAMKYCVKALCLLSTLLVLTPTMHEFLHWPSIASMLPQNLCGNDEDGRIGLSSWLHYICIMLLALCLLSTVCVMNQFLL